MVEREHWTKPLSVWMREFDSEGEVLPMGFVIQAEDMETENARLRTALDATTTLLSMILSTTELSEEHPEEAASYPDMLAPRNRDQFKHVLSQAINVLGPPSDA